MPEPKGDAAAGQTIREAVVVLGKIVARYKHKPVAPVSAMPARHFRESDAAGLPPIGARDARSVVSARAAPAQHHART